MDDAPSTRHRLAVAIVAPSLGILGGQAVQAGRLLDAWQDDPDVRAWLVPINPKPPSWLRLATHVKYLRTVVTQLCYWPLLLRELRRADVVHVFSASYFSFVLSPLPAVLAAKALKRPVLMNYRSGEAPDHLRRSALARKILREADENVVPSKFLQGVFAAHGISARVIPNIIDRGCFRFRSRTRLRPRLLSTRNFEPLYNVACTLRAFALVQRAHPDATLTLVGSGSQEGALRELATSLELKNVTFAGAVDPREIWKYYAAADIYIQTPNIDNMPSSLLEAFASGVAVVSTEAGGVPAMLTDGVHGLLAPVDDHAAIARHVLLLLQDNRLARRLAMSAYESTDALIWERVRNQWIAAYRGLLEHAAAAPQTVRPT